MAEIRKPAVKIRQGKRILFLTFFTVKDFMRDGFYNVDRLDIAESTGMQRLLNNRRIKSFGRDMIGADAKNEAFLPTSVFLATEGGIGFDEKKQELFFDPSSDGGVCPLDVVDGQHRIEGLKWAAESKGNEHLMDFPMSTVIAPNLTEAEKMLQFVVVNTKQESVNPGVSQHIIARFTKMLTVKDLPYLPSWLNKEVEKGDDDKGLTIAKSLNGDQESPWYGRIQLADENRNPNHTIKQQTFVKSVKRHLLARNHPLIQIATVEQMRITILNNFWTAVENIFVDKNVDVSNVVFKSVGLGFFHTISAPIMNQLARINSYRVDDFEKCIRSAESNLSSESAEIMFPNFWQAGNKASGLNSGAIGKLAKAFSDALAQANSTDIQV